MPYADNTVNISVSGPGTFIGKQSVPLGDGRIAFLVQSIHNQTGAITCEVSSGGLASDSCSVDVGVFGERIVPGFDGDQ